MCRRKKFNSVSNARFRGLMWSGTTSGRNAWFASFCTVWFSKSLYGIQGRLIYARHSIYSTNVIAILFENHQSLSCVF